MPMIGVLLGQTIPIPFHPETLHRHVKELEKAYDAIPVADTNGRTAVAMAIVTATASFVEGCLHNILRQHLLTKIGDGILVDDLLRRFRSIETKSQVCERPRRLTGRQVVSETR